MYRKRELPPGMVPLEPGSQVGWVVDLVTGCWDWAGFVNAGGYGLANTGSRAEGTKRSILAHRLLYERRHGAIPAEKELDHLCRNRRCVNPDHMEVVTRLVNVIRGSKTKLSGEAVAAIRAAHRAGATQYRLAKDYRISTRQIGRIVDGESWRMPLP